MLSNLKMPHMKKIFFYILLLSLSFTSCNKKNSCTVTATITQSGLPCSQWGIKIGQTYPSLNIPTEFQHEGLMVCIDYNLYEDMRACVCCGGTWANIKSISLPID
jgi:hypothetical protein